jgi:hypothetical protein
MAKSKYSFEKRQREKARQKKQVDKAARRKEARLPKTDTEPEIQSEDSGISGMESAPQPLLKNTGNADHSEDESQ